MPLEKSSSKGAFVKNLKTEIRAGKPQDQALAIAYEVRRRNRAEGGGVAEADEATLPYGAVSGAMPESSIRSDQLPPDLLIRGMAGMATLPKRAIEGAEQYQRTGDPDAAIGPAVEAALMTMGAGAIVPMRAGEAVFGSGAIRTRYDKALAEGKLTPAEHQGFIDALDTQALSGLAEKFSGKQPNIHDIIRESGLPKEQVHKWLLDEAKAGRVTIHPTTSVDHAPEIYEAAMHVPGFKEPFVNAYFNPSAKRAKGGPVSKALNIAYEARRQARADGGAVFEGPIISDVPGRTDKHPMDVAAGSYVLPSSHVASMGEDNTLAGMKHIKQIGPQGIRKLALSAKGAHDIARKHRMKRALGGAAGEDEKSAGHATPIVAAGGEVVLSPEEVRVIGNGDIELGHRLLDNWIIRGRRDHIKTLQGLAPPARD